QTRDRLWNIRPTPAELRRLTTSPPLSVLSVLSGKQIPARRARGSALPRRTCVQELPNDTRARNRDRCPSVASVPAPAGAPAVAAEWTGVINPLISSYALFADRDSKFHRLVLPYVPSFLFFKDGAALADYSTGGFFFPHFLRRLSLWALPVLCWTGLISVVLL